MSKSQNVKNYENITYVNLIYFIVIFFISVGLFYISGSSAFLEGNKFGFEIQLTGAAALFVLLIFVKNHITTKVMGMIKDDTKQYSIKGNVFDEKGMPVKGVKITISGFVGNVFSDENGFFVFPDIHEQKEWKVKAFHGNFEPGNKVVKKTQAGKPIELVLKKTDSKPDSKKELKTPQNPVNMNKSVSDKEKLRCVLMSGFSETGFSTFVKDNYPDVVAQYGADMMRERKIELLFDYCELHEMMPELHQRVKDKAVPVKYEKCFGIKY